VTDGPEAPSAFVDDPVPARSRPWVDADYLHVERLGTRSDGIDIRAIRSVPTFVERAMRTLLLSLAVLALGLGGVIFANSSSAAHSRAATTPIITGSVGSSTSHNAYEIALSKSTVTPGTYQFNITDYATLHNFDLCKGTSCTSSNSLHKTTVGGTGSFSWTVALALGTYTYQCDVHKTEMIGHLKVAPAVLITSVTPTRTLVTVAAKASQGVLFTGYLLKGTTQLAIAGTSVSATTATLNLKPSTTLQPGSYVVRVRGTVGGVSTYVAKAIQVS